MRWHFGRSSTATDGFPAPTPDAGVAPAIVRPHDAWRSLPALQRAVGAPPTVAPARPFVDSLATRRAPALALEPLGHEISPLASPGLVAGVATPVGAAHSGRVDLRLQRSIAGEHGTEPEAVGWSSFEITGPVPSSPGTPPGDPGATAPSPVRPVMVQRLAASEPILTTSTATTVPAAPAGLLDLRPARPALAELPRAGALPQARATEPVPAGSTPRRPADEHPARRPTLGQARRLGLGAPLGPAFSTSAQRDVPPASGLPAGDRLAVALPGRTADLGGSPAGQAMTATPAGSDPKPGSVASPPSDAGYAHEPGRDPGLLPVVRPITIQRLAAIAPIESLASRSGEAGPTAAAEMSLVLVPSGSSAAAQPPTASPVDPGSIGPWSGPAAGARDSDDPDADRPTTFSPLGGGPIRVSSSDSLLMPVAGGTGNDLVRTTKVAQSAAGEAVVARSVTDASRTATAGGRSGSRTPPALEGGRRSEPAGPVAIRTIASAGSSATGTGPGMGAQEAARPMAVQRAVQINELVIRPTMTDPAPGTGAPSGAAASQAGGGGTAPAAAASPADRERDLDDLAGRLYGRIRSRLSAELLADRERAGMLTDLR